MAYMAPLPTVDRKGQVFQDCTDCPVLVHVPAGSFMMGQAKGDPSAAPQHTVTVRAFAIGQYPVTVGEWKACVAGGGCNFTPRMTNADDRTPVHNVSWDDAEQYIAWLSQTMGKTYRLPTEAEWEYAARANTTTRYWWGDSVGTDAGELHRLRRQPGCQDAAGRGFVQAEPVRHSRRSRRRRPMGGRLLVPELSGRARRRRPRATRRTARSACCAAAHSATIARLSPRPRAATTMHRCATSPTASVSRGISTERLRAGPCRPQRTWIVIFFEVTGGSCGTWSASPMRSCSV